MHILNLPRILRHLLAWSLHQPTWALCLIFVLSHFSCYGLQAGVPCRPLSRHLSNGFGFATSALSLTEWHGVEGVFR